MQNARLKRILIIGIIGIIYSLFLVIDAFFISKEKLLLILAGGLFICSIIFIIMRNKIVRINKKKISQK